MKYIKTYEDYEYYKSDISPNIESEIRDTLLPLIDKGLNIITFMKLKIDKNNKSNYAVVIEKSLRLSKESDLIKVSDIKEDLEFVINYLKDDLNIDVDKIEYRVNSGTQKQEDPDETNIIILYLSI